MANFSMPPGGDPTTIAWLRLSRVRRRRALREARAGLRTIKPDLTKAQRRAATPWQPIVVPAGDAHFLSGRPSQETARLILLGLNRRERRALRAKSGPRQPIGFAGDHVTRSDRRTTALLDRSMLYRRVEGVRQRIAGAQQFQGSFAGRALRLLTMFAAVPMVGIRRIKDAIRSLFGGSRG